MLCVFGNDPFDGGLEKLAKNHTVGGHTIQVKHIVTLESVPSCHIVFVGAPEPAPVRDIVTAAENASVLLVGDSADFAKRGGTMNFFTEKGKVRFAINRRAADAAGLKVSSRMLRLAVLVAEDRSALRHGEPLARRDELPVQFQLTSDVN